MQINYENKSFESVYLAYYTERDAKTGFFS